MNITEQPMQNVTCCDAMRDLTCCDFFQGSGKYSKRIAVVALVVAAIVTAAYFSVIGALGLSTATAGNIEALGAFTLWGASVGLSVSALYAIYEGAKFIGMSGNDSFNEDSQEYLKSVATAVLVSAGGLALLGAAFGSPTPYYIYH